MRISFSLVLLFAVGAAVAATLENDGKPTDHVGLVGPRATAMAPALRLEARAAGRRIRLQTLGSAAAASRAVHAGDVDVALVDGTRLVVQGSRSGPAVDVVQQAVADQVTFTRFRGLGLTQDQALEATAPPPPPVAVLDPEPSEDDQALVAIGMIALFAALVGFGNAVAVSVTEEKASRVIELLLTTMPPRRLLTGKVIGIGVLGVGEIAVVGAAALAGAQIAGGSGLPEGAAGTVALVVLWFLLGFAFYSVAFAAVGALVSRQEDLSAAVTPLTLLLSVAYWISLLAVDFGRDPHSTLAEILAFVPPVAPMIVPTLVVAGDMGALALLAAIALDIAATVGLIWIAARVYERAILRIGAPVSLRSVFGAGESPAWRLQGEDHVLRVGVAALLAGGLFTLQSGPSLATIALVVIGLGLVVIAVLRRARPG
jgi:ABC-2 type transport system permease protein